MVLGVLYLLPRGTARPSLTKPCHVWYTDEAQKIEATFHRDERAALKIMTRF